MPGANGTLPRWLVDGARLLSRFSLVGILATLTYIVVANGVTWLELATAPIASIGAYLCGMIVSYVGQSRFTYKVEKTEPVHLTKFVLLSAIGLIISYYAPHIIVEKMGYPAFASTITVALLVPAISFVLMTFWIFKPTLK